MWKGEGPECVLGRARGGEAVEEGEEALLVSVGISLDRFVQKVLDISSAVMRLRKAQK